VLGIFGGSGLPPNFVQDGDYAELAANVMSGGFGTYWAKVPSS
jgi:hypothetical protein